MKCPNCGQPHEPGATVCLSCGSLLASVAPAPAPQTYPSPPVELLPSSSGAARASLGLGIGGIVCIIAVYLISFAYRAQLQAMDIQSQAEAERLVRDNPVLWGTVVCCFAGELAAVLGLIFGITGLSQEKERPTRNGRTFSIVGIILNALPLLCCVGYFVLFLILTAGGG